MVTLRLGTRGSQLAMLQARHVATQITQHFPKISIEIIAVETTGDQRRDVALQELDGVGFFTKEIDQQLLAGNIDIAVHCLKDLGTIRPQGLVSTTILPRDNPRDIIYFHSKSILKIQQGQPLVIGTSSPRRKYLLEEHLPSLLPQTGRDSPKIITKLLRGNVETRLKKLRNGDYDAIVLAYAGPQRMMYDQQTAPLITSLVQGLKRMVLPLTLCPGAPAQGALCLEICNNRDDLKPYLAPLHDQLSADLTYQERQVLRAYGGGCHQPFGVTALQFPSHKTPCIIQRGQTVTGDNINRTTWHTKQPSPYASQDQIMAITKYYNLFCQVTPLSIEPPKLSASKTAILIARSHALPDRWVEMLTHHTNLHIWVSGVKTWQRLAKRGLWIEGCGDGFGFAFIKGMLQDPILDLPALKNWHIFTHQDAVSTWSQGQVLATYKLSAKHLSQEMQASLKKIHYVYWTSVWQYDALHSYFPNVKLHACGVGKTYEGLVSRGVKHIIRFPTQALWQNWLKGAKI
jgi:hydroxymethylbilane synthase